MENRFVQIRRVLVLALGANLLLGALKMTLGLLTGSLSLVADAYHSLLDSLSSLIGYLGARVAEKPPDQNHPYGHRKFETLGAMAISVMLGMVAVEIGTGIFDRIRQPIPVQAGPLSLAVMGVAILIHLGISRMELHFGKKLRSELLTADGQHAMSDAWSTILALCALGGAHLGVDWLDVAAAGLIILLIIRAAFGMVRSAIEGLTDTAQIGQEEIQAFVNGIEHVGQCHRVRTRGAGGDVFMDMHLRVDPKMSVARLHRLEHEVERAIRHKYPEVKDLLIHFEPWEEMPAEKSIDE